MMIAEHPASRELEGRITVKRNRALGFSFAASLAIHLTAISLASVVMVQPQLPEPYDKIIVELLDLPPEAEKKDAAILAAGSKNLTPPKIVQGSDADIPSRTKELSNKQEQAERSEFSALFPSSSSEKEKKIDPTSTVVTGKKAPILSATSKTLTPTEGVQAPDADSIPSRTNELSVESNGQEPSERPQLPVSFSPLSSEKETKTDRISSATTGRGIGENISDEWGLVTRPSGGTAGGGSGQGLVGKGTRARDGSGRGIGADSGQQTAFARPLGGYQIKPRYPDSARREGAEGTTLLKVQVLENGKVGQILVERSAGHPDLDESAAEAVKKWHFEPARRGNEPIAVWVRLPVRFELR